MRFALSGKETNKIVKFKYTYLFVIINFGLLSKSHVSLDYICFFEDRDIIVIIFLLKSRLSAKGVIVVVATISIVFVSSSVYTTHICRERLEGIEINSYPLSSIARPTIGKHIYQIASNSLNVSLGRELLHY